MWTLRLVLIALGIAFVAGLYFYTRRHPPGRRAGRGELRDPAGTALRAREPIEPRVTLGQGPAVPEPSAPQFPQPPFDPVPDETRRPPRTESAEAKLFALAVRLPGEGAPAGSVSQALIRLGCVPGEGIYRYAPDGGEALYCVASLFEPGILDPLPPETQLRGLVFFFEAPPGREAGARFQRMLGAVRECAGQLHGRVEDQAHRPLTAARELEIRLAAAGERNPS